MKLRSEDAHADSLRALGTPVGEIVLRLETPADEPFRRALFDAVWLADPSTATLPSPLRDQLADLQFRAQSAGYAADFPQAAFDIVEMRGTRIGRVVVDRSGEAIRLVDIALLPRWRNRGVGSALVEALKDEADCHDRPLRLSVFAANSGARRLYDRLGFHVATESEARLELVWRAASIST